VASNTVIILIQLLPVTCRIAYGHDVFYVGATGVYLKCIHDERGKECPENDSIVDIASPERLLLHAWSAAKSVTNSQRNGVSNIR